MDYPAAPLLLAADSFFAGSLWFNVATFVVGILGLILAIAALVVTIAQISRVLRAAEAATNAAKEAREQLVALAAVVDLQKLCSVSSDAVTLLRHGNVRGAAVRLLDLREAAAAARYAPGAAELLTPKRWQNLLTQIGVLHDAVESPGREAGPALPTDHIHELAAIHETLSGLAQLAANNSGTSR